MFDLGILLLIFLSIQGSIFGQSVGSVPCLTVMLCTRTVPGVMKCRPMLFVVGSKLGMPVCSGEATAAAVITRPRLEHPHAAPEFAVTTGDGDEQLSCHGSYAQYDGHRKSSSPACNHCCHPGAPVPSVPPRCLTARHSGTKGILPVWFIYVVPYLIFIEISKLFKRIVFRLVVTLEIFS